MIFTTFENDIDKASAQWGIFGKSFQDIATAITGRINDINKSFQATDDLMASFKNSDSIWKRLYTSIEPVQEAPIDVDAFYPIIDNEHFNFDYWINELNDTDKKVKNNSTSWQDYSDSLQKNQKWIAQWGQETEGQIRTQESMIKANKSARKSAMDHNKALKAQTLSAKAGKAALSALAAAGNMLVMFAATQALQFAVTKLDEWIVTNKEAREAANNFANSIAEYNQSTASGSNAISELNGRYHELSQGVNSMGQNISLSAEEYQEYKDIVSQVSELIPDLNVLYNENGEKIRLMTDSYRGLNKEYEAYQQRAAQDLLTSGNENGNNLSDIIENLNRSNFSSLGDEIKKKTSTLFYGIMDTSDNYSTKDILEYLHTIQTAAQDGNKDRLKYLFNGFKSGDYGYLAEDLFDIDQDDIEDMNGSQLNSLETKINNMISKYEGILNKSYSDLRDVFVLHAKADDSYWNMNGETQGLVSNFLSSITNLTIDHTGLKNSDGNFDEYLIEDYVKQILKAFTEQSFTNAVSDLYTFDSHKESGTVSDIMDKLNSALGIVAIKTGFDPDQLLQQFGLSDTYTEIETWTNTVKNMLRNDVRENVGSLSLNDLKFASTLKVEEGTLLTWEELAAKIEISRYSLKALDQAAKTAKSIQNPFSDVAAKFQHLSDGLSQLGKIYADISDKGNFDWSAMLNNQEFANTFSAFTKEYNVFIQTISNTPDDINACQSAFNQLVTAYLNGSDAMKNLSSETKDTTIRMLEQMGVANAGEIITNRLAAQEAFLAEKKINSSIESDNLTDATWQELSAMLAVTDASAQTQSYLSQLALSKLALSQKPINSEADVNAILGIAKAAGFSEQYINSLSDALVRLEHARSLKEEANQNNSPLMSAAALGMATAEESAAQSELNTFISDFKNGYVRNKLNPSSFTAEYTGFAAADASDVNTGTGSNSTEKPVQETPETFNWIETAINRLTIALDRLKTKAADTYASWTARSYDLHNAITSTQQAIELHAQAYNRYMAQADSVPLSGAWKNLVQGGAVDISNISDSSLAEQIREYQTWYDKAQDCLRTQEDLRGSLNELESQKFTNLQSEYESIISLMEVQKSVIENQITVLSNSADYDRLRTQQTNILTALQNERNVLEATLGSLSLQRGTEEWNSLQTAIFQVSQSIQDAEASLQEINRMQFDNLKQFYELSIGLMEKQKDIAEGRITLLSSDQDYQSLQQQQQSIITKSEEELKKLNEYKASSAFSGLSHEDQMSVLSDIADKTASLDEAYRTLKEISELQFDNIKNIFEFESGRLEHTGSLIDDKISLSEVRGLYAENKLYKDQLNLNQSQQTNINQEIKKLTDIRDTSGYAIGTAEWNSMTSEIMSLREQESKLTLEAAEINKTLRETDWEIFDSLAGSVDGLIEESDFLSSLMGHEKQIDENGNFTDAGEATLSLKLVNADVQKQKAEQYFAEARRLEPYMGRNSGTEVLNRYNELINAGQDALLEQKSSIKEAISLVEERYQAELDALQNVINKKKEQLQEEKDLYDYQKSIREKTDRIASLEKQKTAYADDSSEETMAKIQRIQLELNEAKEDLEETEYEKYLSDSQNMLDNLAQDYEDWMNVRLDNEEALLVELAANVNSASQSIKDTLESIAEKNGVQLSEHMSQIFSGMQTLSDRFGTDTGTISGTEQAATDKRQEYMDAAGLLPDGLTLEQAQTILKKALKILPNPEGFTLEDAQKALNIALRIDKGYTASPSGTSKPTQADVQAFSSSDADAAPIPAASKQTPAQESSRQAEASNTPDFLLPPSRQGGMLLTEQLSKHLFDTLVHMETYKDASALHAAQGAITSMISPQSHIHIGEINMELPDIQDYSDFRRRLVQDKTFEKAMCTMVNNAIMGKSTIDKLKYL